MNYPTPTAYIIANLQNQVKQYLDNCNDKYFQPYQCKHCKNKVCLYWVCSYFGKNIISLDLIREIQSEINQFAVKVQ